MSWESINENSVQNNSSPFVLYFCSEQLAQTAGIGTDALRAKIKGGVKILKRTIFENNLILDSFKKAGINTFYKVTATKENQILVKKYNVTQDNTLLFCAPNGDLILILVGGQCNDTEVLKVLKTWPEIFKAWQKTKN